VVDEMPAARAATTPATRGQTPPPARPPRGKVAAAAKIYLNEGNTALKTDDWAEF